MAKASPRLMKSKSGLSSPRSVQTERGEDKPDFDFINLGDAFAIGRDGRTSVAWSGLTITFRSDTPDGPKTFNYRAPKQDASSAMLYFEDDGWAVVGGAESLRLVRRDGTTFAFPMPEKEAVARMAATD